jgi:hypothetical protein
VGVGVLLCVNGRGDFFPGRIKGNARSQKTKLPEWFLPRLGIMTTIILMRLIQAQVYYLVASVLQSASCVWQSGLLPPYTHFMTFAEFSKAPG